MVFEVYFAVLLKLLPFAPKIRTSLRNFSFAIFDLLPSILLKPLLNLFSFTLYPRVV